MSIIAMGRDGLPFLLMAMIPVLIEITQGPGYAISPSRCAKVFFCNASINPGRDNCHPTRFVTGWMLCKTCKSLVDTLMHL